MTETINIYSNKAYYYPENARDIILYADKEINIREHKKNNDIQTLCLGDYEINLGDSLSVKINDRSTPYRINYITKTQTRKYLLKSEILTKSSFFVFPVLGGTKSSWCWNSYMINTYITKDIEELGDYFYIKYLFSSNPDYKLFEHQLMNHPYYSGHEDINAYHTMFRFSIPFEFKKDIVLLSEGKYSRLSKKLKENIMRFHGFTQISPVYQAFVKSKSLKEEIENYLDVKLDNDAELLSRMILNEEIVWSGGK